MAKEFKNRYKENTQILTLDTTKHLTPQALEVELNILGAMLLDNRIIDKVIEMLNPEMFYSVQNRKVYNAIESIYKSNNPVDTITLLEELRRTSELDEVGGVGFITELTSNIASAANIEYYCKILIEKHMLRQLINASLHIARRCYESTEDTFKLLDEAEASIFEIAENKFKKTFTSIDGLVKEAVKIIQQAAKHKGIPDLPSGYDEFDALTGGFQPSDLTIIAARPGMGKTAFGLSIAANMAFKYNIPVGFFSLEMTSIQLVMRILSAEALVNNYKLRKGIYNSEEETRIMRTSRRIVKGNIFIDDTSSLTVLELRAKIRRMIKENKVRIVFIDYLQLMQGPQNLEREREISFISRSLKGLAKELNIPIVAMAQLNRLVEQRKGKPILSDLRESGAIEQDADNVIFIHRPGKSEAEKTEQEEENKNLAEIIIAKQRNGPTGSFKLVFKEEYTRFENITDQQARDLREPQLEEPNF